MADTRKRQRPTKPVSAVRKRERPTKARTTKTDPRMPDSWPNGSALVRPPSDKHYVDYRRPLGTLDEDNPNLIGRIINDRSYIDPKYVAWRWYEGRYHWFGEYEKHYLAVEALSNAASKPRRKRLKRTG